MSAISIVCSVVAACSARIGDRNGGEDDYVAFGDPPALACTSAPAGTPSAQNLTREAVWNDSAKVIEVYDLATCALEHAVAHPDGDGGDFAAALAMSDPVDPAHDFDREGHLWVGAPAQEYKRCTNVFCTVLCPSLCASQFHGLVYGMPLDNLDADWGPVDAVVDNPVKKADVRFGAAIAVDDQILAIGSPGNRRVYVLTGPTNELVELSGTGVVGPIGHLDGDYYALTGPGENFGAEISIEWFPPEPISSTTERVTRRVWVGSNTGATCFELTGEQGIYDPPADCPTDGIVPTECFYPLPPFSWSVSSCE